MHILCDYTYRSAVQTGINAEIIEQKMYTNIITQVLTDMSNYSASFFIITLISVGPLVNS